ncbi:MAG TPA: hypothetical protein VK886_12070 [Vicinamibacterales bacterium]|nr:hypothetical protein [Vicinamibacterales bacterium]
MDEELGRSYGRWRTAEVAGRDDEADSAFKGVFAAAPRQEPSLQFTARAMRAVAESSATEVRQARQTRRGLIAGGALGGLVALYFGAGLIASAVSATLLGLLDLLVATVVNTASAVNTGADVWSVLGALGRAAAAFVADPKVTITLLAIQGVAAMALFALQRLLGTDGESFK